MISSYKVLIVDDEPKGIRLIKNHLERHRECKIIGAVSSVDEAILSMSEEIPDLILLDIDMPGKNGFDLVKAMERMHIYTTVVFVTAYEQYALEAIKHSAFDYILKPIRASEFDEMLVKYREKLSKELMQQEATSMLNNLQKSEKLRFNQKGQTVFINPEDILYCKANGNYTVLYLDQDKTETVSHHLKEVQLLLGKDFQRLGRSTIFNKSFLVKIDRRKNVIGLKKGAFGISIPVSSRLMNQI